MSSNSEFNGNYIMGHQNVLKVQIMDAVEAAEYDVEPSRLMDEVSCESSMTLSKYLDQLVEAEKLRETRDVCHTTMYDTVNNDD